ncbi:polyprenol monophosphomannose synthase [Rhodanobacter sp. MP1X3]|uniref:polyprenol monophosphomannose synthase n=1 Tax=Rhodanobacter sp. MP1X3 TaxID=2723086 RepID=UPI001620B95D|nr:polyprenol monophosphomannose synthase [Rhodanobacter sp. MP1X3]MBB6241548.1 glycosyltransferase involved in cell wall biosynthesis [Rhodanobacter sp. MP1X3]
MPKTLVFFATYNEAGNVAQLLASIAEFAPNSDVLVVDDNSPDRTVEIMRSMEMQRLVTLVRKEKLGLGTAHILAISYAQFHGYDVLVTMDGDMSHDPSYLPAMFAGINEGADVVIGSRYMRGGSCDYTGYRRYVSKLGNVGARWLLGIKLHEFTTSFRAFRMSSMSRINRGNLLVGGYSFFMMMIAEAASRGLCIKEIPIHFRERGYGVSKIPPLEIFRGIANLGRLAIRRVVSARPGELFSSPTKPCVICGNAYSFIEIGEVKSADRASVAGVCVFCGSSA